MRIARSSKTRSENPESGIQDKPVLANATDASQQVVEQTDWSALIPENEWSIYRAAIDAVRAGGLPFLLGGGFAMSTYIQRWRETKDIDFYVLPRDRDAMVDVLTRAGFGDYYPELPYDRGWIYRSVREGLIVDVIWAMANRRAWVDELWFERATTAILRGETFRVLPVEELIWAKLYVLQGDRCDWPDVINVLHAALPALDWDHLLRRIEDDVELLRSALTLFAWVSPRRAAEIPEQVRQRLGLSKPAPVTLEEEQRRRSLLDTRGWFAASQPTDKPLEV